MQSVTVTEIGRSVSALMGEGMIVLFGPNAPAELRDICVIHDGKPASESALRVGGTIAFGEQEYRIMEVGGVANENFAALGHLTVQFSRGAGILPGSIRVEPETPPVLSVGDTIACS